MLIATWNVNSIKSRLDHVLAWAEKNMPDVILLQELKNLDFPAEAFAALGYHVEHVGQKAYNGVATLSLHPINVIARTLPGDKEDTQARYLETDIKKLRVINIYLPNGNPVGTEKFEYKLAWMARLQKKLNSLKRQGIKTVIGGDFNVIPEDIDCFSPKYWKKDALFQPEPRELFRKMVSSGYVDAFRHFNQEPGHYTFWEYFRDSFKKNQGIRIDHFLVSSSLKNKLAQCMIDKGPRALPKPSDHTPIILAIR